MARLYYCSDAESEDGAGGSSTGSGNTSSTSEERDGDFFVPDEAGQDLESLKRSGVLTVNDSPSPPRQRRRVASAARAAEMDSNAWVARKCSSRARAMAGLVD